ncbi:multifunctional transcriptional regulator/nicotinamide-nucleotide adenylyltransferase/ribosylnicotinamide kinase NadR [Paenibacillus agilis]|uniref:Multifunctional transcriptional regulator/nicotinamide-nucleotide adenylyltransferase/ribosylnicotinamide kinase NadR n=1 Tax=Paenibacillus agilis TaxID=3020863 RepID=A0A559IEB5_9BACL|nr:multifunctional transcriptional regulator/nicotinamide-nucleotide adenylyltransferase/ribosylnicotinamide kinase NadR [Paenibacillus agilis]TVX86001.1 multifunctional transcriptional regulator/nicotinamide-nucleotide adenylyltransferase/ribosylnicotinamide kinase NadR [Paenibacillus agilis]
MTIGKVGMYGGKFLPFPHLGHVYAMIRASTMVDELHVIVSFDTEYEKMLCEKGGKVEHVDYAMRLRWWTQLTKDLPHVHVHAVYEEQTGQLEDWVKGAEGIQKEIGKPIDAVFSSEHSYTPIFEKLYPTAKHVVIDSERETYSISGTKLREEGVMKHWNMIPKIVQPYFAKKVVIVGTESCGKSTLVKNLANLYNTTYVEEFGRTYYERLGGCEGITRVEDYAEIAFEHKYHEKVQLQNANKVMFIDTEAVVTQYFSQLYLSEKQPILDEIIKLQQYDLWLFLEPDVKWVDDGTRSFGEQEVRENNNNLLKEMLTQYGVQFVTISGNYQERLEKAVHYVNELTEMKGL